MPQAAKRSRAAVDKTRKQGTAVLAAALLNYADGKRRNKSETDVAKTIEAIPGGRAAALRIAKRVRAQSAAVRNRHLGPYGVMLSRPTSPSSLADANAKAIKGGYNASASLHLQEAHTLPPQGLATPSHVAFTLAGVRCNSTQDADGSDELVVVTKFFKLLGLQDIGQAMDNPGAAQLSVSAGTTSPSGAKHDAWTKVPMFVVSAVAEADGSAVQTTQELDVAIELARALALKTNTEHTASAFGAALEYTEGLMALSNPANAPSFEGFKLTSGLESWWAAPPSKTDGLEWKAEVPHHLPGGGDYSVLYDVPHAFDDATIVGVELKDLDLRPDPKRTLISARVSIEIGNASHDETFPLHINQAPSMHVRRSVQPALHKIRIGVVVEYRLKAGATGSGWCGDLGSKRPEVLSDSTTWPYEGLCKSQTEAYRAGHRSDTADRVISYDAKNDQISYKTAPYKGASHTFSSAYDFITLDSGPVQLTLRVYDAPAVTSARWTKPAAKGKANPTPKRRFRRR